ncbi:hypothetical protein BC835DRAFT_524043 [Cytidiella melzeri]|nr:hypothetical protein BC835DRAFT_524043 [Cytidiella melzeri]
MQRLWADYRLSQMVHRHIATAESYSVLGLSEGATLEVVKSTYKQMALRTHPDKNPGNADATVQFQRVSEAYNVLLKHLDKSTSPPRQHPRAYNSYATSTYDSEDDEYSDDEYSDSDDYDSEDDFYDEERMEFYMYLFEEMLRGSGGRFSQARFQQECDCPVHRRHREERVKETETEEAFQARTRRAREEQEVAEERRKRDDAYRKAEQEKEREKGKSFYFRDAPRLRPDLWFEERQEAEKRQKEKASKKKAKAEQSRMAAVDKVRVQQQQSQSLRSAVFAAARSGDAEAVKRGVWQDAVDAAGGEAKNGCESWVNPPPHDPHETLTHIAASRGDSNLLEWLDTHGADQEERDSKGFTPFHVALSKGHIPILKYTLEAHPYEDTMSLYERPPSQSNLELALNSRVPEAVWLVLEHKICTSGDMQDMWAQLTSTRGRLSFLKAPGLQRAEEKLNEIINLLISFGKCADVGLRGVGGLGEQISFGASVDSASSAEPTNSVPQYDNGRSRGRHYHESNAPPRTSVPHSPVPDLPSPGLTGSASPSNTHRFKSRSKGRGRGRGHHGRGGFRGRGRGSAPTS